MTNQAAPNKKNLTHWYAWVVLIVVWLAAFTAPANMVKVTALAAPIMEWFMIDEASVSWVMSMFYIMGCVFAFPAAGIMKKLGIRKTVVIALVFEIVGGALGVLSGNTLSVFMVSRALEGVSWGLLAVAGIPAISAWFAPAKRGLPMGIWGIWVAVAFIVGPLLFAGMFDSLGVWQPVWWLNVVFDAAILVVFLLLYRDADFSFDDQGNRIEHADDGTEDEVPKGAYRTAFKAPAVLCAAIAMLFMCGAQMAIENFLPTYIFENLDASLTIANLVASGGAVAGVVFSIVLGKLSDLTGKTKVILVVTVVFGLIYSWIAFQTTDLAVYIFIVICIGIAEGGGPAMLFTILAKGCPEEALPAGSAILAFMQNLGMLIGTTLIGTVVSNLGWAVGAHYVAVPLYALVIVVALLFWKKVK